MCFFVYTTRKHGSGAAVRIASPPWQTTDRTLHPAIKQSPKCWQKCSHLESLEWNEFMNSPGWHISFSVCNRLWETEIWRVIMTQMIDLCKSRGALLTMFKVAAQVQRRCAPTTRGRTLEFKAGKERSRSCLVGWCFHHANVVLCAPGSDVKTPLSLGKYWDIPT